MKSSLVRPQLTNIVTNNLIINAFLAIFYGYSTGTPNILHGYYAGTEKVIRVYDVQ
jgi:hypothetical protein